MSGGDKCPDTFRIHDWTNEPASGGEGAAGSDDCSVLIAARDRSWRHDDVTLLLRAPAVAIDNDWRPAARQLVVNFFSVREFWNYCLPNLQTRVCLGEKTEVIANHACNRDSQCHVTITCSVTKTTKSYNICSAIADRSSYRPTKLGSWNPTKLWGVRLHAVESRKFGACAVTSPSFKISMHLWLTSLHL